MIVTTTNNDRSPMIGLLGYSLQVQLEVIKYHTNAKESLDAQYQTLELHMPLCSPPHAASYQNETRAFKNFS